MLILSVLLLPFINRIEPQVVAREVIIQALVEMGFNEAQRACLSTTPSHGGLKHLLRWNDHRTPSYMIPLTHELSSSPPTLKICIVSNVQSSKKSIERGRETYKASIRVRGLLGL